MSGKKQAVLLLVLMFGLGVASGIAWQRYRFHHFWNPHTMFADRRIKILSKDLKLTPTQEQQMHDILQKAHERAMQVNEEVSWDLADIHKDTVKAIHKILTPEQTVEFERIHKKFHSKHRHISDQDDDDSLDDVPAATHS